jgi:hypothetical protein
VSTAFRLLAALAICAAIAIVAISSGKQLRRANTRGDVEVYVHGARLALAGEDLYAVPEPRGNQPYLYLPLFAVAAIPLALVPIQATVISWTALSVALALWIVVAFYRAMTGESFFALPERRRWALAFFSILLTLRALLYHFDLGQANLLVMAIAVAGLVELRSGRPILAGLALGLAPVFKTIALPLWIPFLVQGRWRVLAGIAGGAGLGLLLPAVYFGFDRNASYVSYWLNEIILPVNDLRSTRHWPLRMNFSLAAQVYRFFSDVVAFDHRGVFYSVTIAPLPDAALHALGRFATVLVAAAIGLYAWVHRRREPLVGLWGAVALAFCLAPAFSPMAHKHYWVMLLPAHVYVVYLWSIAGIGDRWFRGLVAASFAVAMLSTTLFSGLGALMAHLGGLVWGSALLAAAIFRAASVVGVETRSPSREPRTTSRQPRAASR